MSYSVRTTFIRFAQKIRLPNNFKSLLVTRLAAARDKVYQLLAHGWWISPGTPASSTTNTGRHDIADILLKVALNIKNQSIKSTKRLLKLFGSLPECPERSINHGQATGKLYHVQLRVEYSVLFVFVLCTLCCQFLWIVHFSSPAEVCLIISLFPNKKG
jgi:hypothetical protein